MKTFGSFYRVVGLCSFSALATTMALSAPQTGTASVRDLRGSVMIDSATAKVGDVAKPGSTISTGADSRAVLFLGVNGPDLNVLANSRLSIDDLSFDDAGVETVISTKLGLREGQIEGNVKKTSAQSSYIVTTPTTTAAIRGTVFTVSARGEVYVWEGCVDVVFRDPATARTSNFNVCRGQMFEPSVPGVVDIPAGGITPFVNAAPSTQVPVGPYTVISPIQGRSSTAPNTAGE